MIVISILTIIIIIKKIDDGNYSNGNNSYDNNKVDHNGDDDKVNKCTAILSS